ncbi:MAG: hypothetical protein E6G79_21510 [Alphaproteobacteria bacterium]|nr:MAG: hypothetical protein E6G79_21510 [Alphaproteobacteria bacterium]
MRRRDFLIGVAMALPLAAEAQQRQRISILHSGYPRRTAIKLLFDALGKLGYDEAQIDLLGGEGDSSRLTALVDQLALRKPDVIIAITSPAVVALKNAKLNIPVVFAFVPDPVELGIVESLARPGGHFTGVTYSEAGLGGKRLELLIDAIAGMTRTAVFWSSSFPGHDTALESIRTSASARGIEIFSRPLGGVDDLSPAFDDVLRAKAQAAVFMSDNTMFGHRKQVADLALAHIHSCPPEARDGGQMSYGPSNDENYKRAAALTDRILRGARPSDLPVEQPTRFELVVNLKTAKALGLTLPPTLLARADEVIE